VGAAYGYAYGGPHYTFRTAAGEADQIAALLRALRRGDVDFPITILEGNLDIAIINDGRQNVEMDWLLGWWFPYLRFGNWPSNRPFMERVAKYREEFPGPPSPLRSEVDAHLQAFRTSRSN
jgi:hypothetical protein